MAQYPATDSMGRDYDDPDYNKEGGYAGRGGTDNRINAKNFLNKFATGVNESMESDRNRSSNTEAAQGGRSSSASKDSDDKVRSGMAKLGDDVSVQEGYRPGEWTMEGTPGKKGILGHVARGAGAAFGGPMGAMAGNVAGSYLDYV